MLSNASVLSTQVRYKLFIAVTAAVGAVLLLLRFTSSSPLRNNVYQTIVASSHTKSSPIQDIQNSTLGFQRIIAINLPERTDHRDSLTVAAAVSDLNVEFVDGVHHDSVASKALPQYNGPVDMLPGALGAWRAHINVLSKVVNENITSALIIEDDVDWDIRLKSLLQDFAISTTNLLGLPRDPNSVQPTQPIDLQTLSASEHSPSPVSPYGSSWDVLWLGHCGMTISDVDAHIVHYDDPSVPVPAHLRSWDIKATTPLSKYPNHTREFGYVGPTEATCSLAYAVSQLGARKLLWELGSHAHLDRGYDLMLRNFCAQPLASEDVAGQQNTRNQNTCFSVLPQLFDHHRSIGNRDKDSDISAPSDSDDINGDRSLGGPGPSETSEPSESGRPRQRSFTFNIRWSVRANMEKLLQGATSNWIDQWPDR